jgi:CheY-like chemotaxis protein
MKTILVVDDEPDILGALELFLEMEGYRVMTASDGQEAITKLADVRPDLVLSDVMMPFLNGIELLQHVKSDRGLQNIPVVLMSAGRPAGWKCGATGDAFLPKPLDLDHLLRTIQQELAKRGG